MASSQAFVYHPYASWSSHVTLAPVVHFNPGLIGGPISRDVFPGLVVSIFTDSADSQR